MINLFKDTLQSITNLISLFFFMITITGDAHSHVFIGVITFSFSNFVNVRVLTEYAGCPTKHATELELAA